MSFLQVKLEGADEIRKKLESIKNNTAKKHVRKAIKIALYPTLQAAKSNAMGMVGGVMGSMITTALRIQPFRRQKNHAYGMNVQLSKDYSPAFVHNTKGGLRYYIPSAIQFGHAKRGKTKKAIDAMLVIKKKWATRATKAALREAVATEYGSDKVPAIPFMRKASDLTLSKTPQIFAEILKQELKI